MLERLARWLGGVALHWFYRDVSVTGSDRIPASGPLLIAINHQNALVDAILALCVVPRRIRLTAKATLGDTIFGAVLMKMVGIIPLQRTSDDPASSDPTRNRRSFEAIIEEMRMGGAVLMFPEGRSHNMPEIAPLKTGLARAALRARSAGIKGIQIVPIGITFEDKANPSTLVLAQVGQPILMDDWPGNNPHELTDTVAERLRNVSLVGTIHPTSDHHPIRRNPLVWLAVWWGWAMHWIPLRVARYEALRMSADRDEIAMYTMTLGLAAVLLSYLIEVSVVAWIFGTVAAVCFLASLVIGAHWAAHARRIRERAPG